MNLCPFLSISANTLPEQNKVDLVCIREKCEVFDLENDHCSLWILSHIISEKQIVRLTEGSEAINKSMTKLLDTERSLKGSVEQIAGIIAPQALKNLVSDVIKDLNKSKIPWPQPKGADDKKDKDPLLIAVEILATKQDEIKAVISAISAEGVGLKKPDWLQELSGQFDSIGKGVSEKVSTDPEQKAASDILRSRLTEIVNLLSMLNEASAKGNQESIVNALNLIKQGQDEFYAGFAGHIEKINTAIAELGNALKTIHVEAVPPTTQPAAETTTEPTTTPSTTGLNLKVFEDFKASWNDFISKQYFVTLPEIPSKIQTLIELLSPQLIDVWPKQNTILGTKLDTLIEGLTALKVSTSTIEKAQQVFSLEPIKAQIDLLKTSIDSQTTQLTSFDTEKISSLTKLSSTLDEIKTHVSEDRLTGVIEQAGEIRVSVDALSRQLASIDTEKINSLTKLTGTLDEIKTYVSEDRLTGVIEQAGEIKVSIDALAGQLASIDTEKISSLTKLTGTLDEIKTYVSKEMLTGVLEQAGEIKASIDLLTNQLASLDNQNIGYLTRLGDTLDEIKSRLSEDIITGVMVQASDIKASVDALAKQFSSLDTEKLSNLAKLVDYTEQIKASLVEDKGSNLVESNEQIKKSIENLGAELSNINTEGVTTLMQLSSDVTAIKGNLEKQDYQFLRDLPALITEGTSSIQAIPDSIGLLDQSFVAQHKSLEIIYNELAAIRERLETQNLGFLAEIPLLLAELTKTVDQIPASIPPIDMTPVNDISTGFKELVTIQREMLDNQRQLSKSNQDLAEAIEKATGIFGKSASELGNLFKEQGERYDRLLSISSKANASLHNDRGMYLYYQKAYSAAIKEFQTALDLDPEAVEVLNNIGLAQIEIGQHLQAEATFNLLLEKRPNLAETYNNMGWLYYNLEDFDRAIDMYSTTLKLNPSFIQAMLNLAQVYEAKKELKEAITTWEKVLLIDPENPTAKDKLSVYKGVS